MDVLTSPPGLPLWSDYTRFARRHAVVIAALMVVGLLAGIAWALQQPSTYSATTSIALQPVPKYVTPSTTELVAPEVTIDTDAQLLQSPKVLGAIGAALGTDADVAAEHLSVSASPNTHVLHVTIKASSRDRAAAAANAAVAALIQVRRDSLGALRQDQLRQLQLLVITQERELAKQQATELVIPATDDLFAQTQELRAGLDELEEARREPAVVVQPATPPRQADYANAEVPAVSGAMLGLLVGCLVGAGRDRLRLLAERPALAHHLPHLSGHLPVTTTLHEDTHHAV
jgi:uncharacterized protein involved in exopolysaccharide biosynthesis